MTELKIAAAICFIIVTSFNASNPMKIDLQKYSGKWYVIGVIPTRFDKGWNYTTEAYTIRPDGNIDVYTTYKKGGSTKTSILKSKGFPIAKENNVRWKVQFFWPIKVDYLIEEIADDYSYVIVGHPKKTFLYIMNRTGKMDETLYTSLVEKCRQKGYDTSQLEKPLQ